MTRSPSTVTAKATWIGRLATWPSRIFTWIASMKDYRVDRIQRPVPPLGHGFDGLPQQEPLPPMTTSTTVTVKPHNRIFCYEPGMHPLDG